jgi:hypothetical protein
MSDCCSSSKKVSQSPKRHVCPENNKQFIAVPYSTVLHHVKDPWKLTPKEQAYYFCDDPDCDVVYFGYDNSIIRKDQLCTKIGIKESSGDALVCYCFGVSNSEAKKDDQAKAFVIEQTKQSLCSCSTYNPSGRCCLKDFPK